MARVRTKFAKAHRLAARSFLRKALLLKGQKLVDCSAKTHGEWVKSANLQPILDYLSK